MIRRAWRYLPTVATYLLGNPEKRKSHRDLVRSLPEPREQPTGEGPTAELPPGREFSTMFVERLGYEAG